MTLHSAHSHGPSLFFFIRCAFNFVPGLLLQLPDFQHDTYSKSKSVDCHMEHDIRGTISLMSIEGRQVYLAILFVRKKRESGTSIMLSHAASILLTDYL